jgi:hypothetical protein
MWNPVREILSRYKIAASNEAAISFYLDETANYFAMPQAAGGYGMEKKRTLFLLGKYSELLSEKKISPLYYDMPWSEVVSIAKKFDALVENNKFIYTLHSGINKGLVNILLFNPENQKLESWKLVNTERSKERPFDPLRDVRDYITNIFGETFMQILPYALIALVLMVIFYKVKK